MIKVKNVGWGALYQGTREELICAGLAVSGMFTHSNGIAMSSKRCISYHPEQGKWRMIKDYKREGAHVYRLYYEHEFNENSLDEFDRQVITRMRDASSYR